MSFVLKVLRANYLKLNEMVLVTNVGSVGCEGSYRFDKLVSSEDLERVKNMDTIKAYITPRLPKIWVEEQEEDPYREISFGRYRGHDDRVKREPGEGIADRLGRIRDARNQDEYYEPIRSGRESLDDCVKRNRRSPSSNGSSSVKRERRRGSPQVESGAARRQDETPRGRDEDGNRRSGSSHHRIKDERREERQRSEERERSEESPVSIVEGNAIAETADAERATSGKKMVVGGDPAVVDEKNIAATTTIANAERRVEMGMVVEMTTITRRASGKEKEARAAPDVLGPTSRQTNIERIVIDQKAWKVEMDSWSGIDSSSRTLTRFKMRDPVETFSDF